MSKGTLNKVFLIGRLGDDPETRYTAQGEAVVTLSIATNDGYKDRDGRFQESTEWHKVVCFKRLAEFATEYLSRGGLVYVEGKLKTNKYQDKQGKECYSTSIHAFEIQMLGTKNNEMLPDPNDMPLVDKRPKKEANADIAKPHSQPQLISTADKFEDEEIPF